MKPTREDLELAKKLLASTGWNPSPMRPRAPTVRWKRVAWDLGQSSGLHVVVVAVIAAASWGLGHVWWYGQGWSAFAVLSAFQATGALLHAFRRAKRAAHKGYERDLVIFNTRIVYCGEVCDVLLPQLIAHLRVGVRDKASGRGIAKALAPWGDGCGPAWRWSTPYFQDRGVEEAWKTCWAEMRLIEWYLSEQRFNRVNIAALKEEREKICKRSDGVTPFLELLDALIDFAESHQRIRNEREREALARGKELAALARRRREREEDDERIRAEQAEAAYLEDLLMQRAKETHKAMSAAADAGMYDLVGEYRAALDGLERAMEEIKWKRE